MNWAKFGLCRGEEPARWFTSNLPQDGRDGAAAALCHGCPVLDRCRDHAERGVVDVSRMLKVDGEVDVVPLNIGVVLHGVAYPDLEDD